MSIDKKLKNRLFTFMAASLYVSPETINENFNKKQIQLFYIDKTINELMWIDNEMFAVGVKTDDYKNMIEILNDYKWHYNTFKNDNLSNTP